MVSQEQYFQHLDRQQIVNRHSPERNEIYTGHQICITPKEFKQVRIKPKRQDSVSHCINQVYVEDGKAYQVTACSLFLFLQIDKKWNKDDHSKRDDAFDIDSHKKPSLKRPGRGSAFAGP